MTGPAPTNPSENLAQSLDVEVQQAIDLCGGDIRAALRTTLIANAFLEAEVERLPEQRCWCYPHAYAARLP